MAKVNVQRSKSRPAGGGPEVLETQPWPDVPVLLLGAVGTGRKTWADYLMSCHEALVSLTVTSETSEWPYSQLVDWIVNCHFISDQVVPRWASLSLDEQNYLQQNKLLSIAENLPANCRLILRASADTIAPALRSRCFVITLKPPTLAETAEILVQLGIRRNSAEELAELRPGRPGLALALAEHLPFRGHLRGVLSAADSRDYTALTSALMEGNEGMRMWFQEWVGSALAQRPMSHGRLAKEAGLTLLTYCKTYLDEVPNPRLAVRAAATVLAQRP